MPIMALEVSAHIQLFYCEILQFCPAVLFLSSPYPIVVQCMYHFSCSNGIRINRCGVGSGEEDQIIIAAAGQGSTGNLKSRKGSL